MNHFIKIALRNLADKPVFSIITFTGFTIGIVASLLIYMWVYYELGYEKFHTDYQQIYRVLTLSKQGESVVKSPMCYRPVATTMKMDYPQIEYATYIYYSSQDSPLQFEGGEKIEARMCATNDDFFKIFNGFEFIEGSAESALSTPDKIVLSEKTAKKIFGDQPALGKTLVNDMYVRETYTVGGVIRIPEQSHIDFGYMLSEKNSRYSGYSNSWMDKYWVRVYIKLRKDAKIDGQFISEASNQVSKYSNYTDKLMFQPLADIHLYSDYTSDNLTKNMGSIKYVLIFSGLALLIVLMAALNFSILSLARASERSTEIGIRKVNGADRSGIFTQFMVESIFQTVSAALFALIIVYFILPWFNSLSGKELTFNFSAKFILNLFILTLLTGVISGLYPSIYLSSLNPVGIFRGGSITGSKTNFIKLLVTIQFSIAIFFIIATLLFVKQMSYISNKDLGIEKGNIIVIPTGLWYDNKSFKDELKTNPNILGVSASTSAPINGGFKQRIPLNFQGITDTLETLYFGADEDFAETYKLEIVKGQFLQMDNNAYWEQSQEANKNRKEGKEYTISIPTVINESAEKILGFDDPIGQRFDNKVIVGVIKDFNIQPLNFPIGPVIINNNPEAISTMSIRIAAANRTETVNFIRETYKKFRDGRDLSYTYFDDLINEKYLAETRLKNMIIAFAILSIVISVLGILGMAVFSIDRRTKEIGIRKVTGARSSEIILLLNLEFLKWVVLAFFIATPVAWVVMNRWLQNFAFKTSFSWWLFIIAGLLAIAIALITISWQSFRAAERNPIEALRYE